MSKIIVKKITYQLKRGTSENWEKNNFILKQGEPGYETDTGMLKIGNGTTPWKELPYISGSGGQTIVVDQEFHPDSPRPQSGFAVSDAIKDKVNKTGTTILNDDFILNNPIAGSKFALTNKAYLESDQVELVGGPIGLNVGKGHKVTLYDAQDENKRCLLGGIASPQFNDDAVNKVYVDENINIINETKQNRFVGNNFYGLSCNLIGIYEAEIGNVLYNAKIGDLFYNPEEGKEYIITNSFVQEDKNQLMYELSTMRPDIQFNSDSANAQSGIAISKAISKQELKKLDQAAIIFLNGGTYNVSFVK